MQSKQKYLMWDIDATLLVSGGAGINALRQVIMDYYQLDAFEFPFSLAGRTDSEIVKSSVIFIRGRCHLSEVASILIRYQMELPQWLPKYQGRIMKNVEKTLQYFDRPESRYENCLLTGNIRACAKLKLEHYHLNQYFNYDHSAFGELAEDRQELARIALQRFYIANPEVTSHDLVFLGDTLNDVRCAQAIGARCIILLDGSSKKREDFQECQPWRILDALPDDPAELEKLLDEE